MTELVRADFVDHRPAVRDRQPASPIIDDVQGSVAANTLRAYGADVRAWQDWCRARGRHAVPADPADVRDYLISLAGQLKASTIARRLAGIGWAHRAAGAPFDPTAPVIAFALDRIRREIGTAKIGKAPLQTAEIRALLAKLPDDLRGTRDRAVLLTGFASTLRRSELAALDLPDIDFVRDGAILHVRRSKGDQHGEGRYVGIAYGRREATCPVRALMTWLREGRIVDGAVFRQMRGSVVTDHRLGDRAIYEVVKAACGRAGLDPERFGAHSLRSGHITQFMANGGRIEDAQAQAGHADPKTTATYDRRRRAVKESTSRKLGL